MGYRRFYYFLAGSAIIFLLVFQYPNIHKTLRDFSWTVFKPVMEMTSSLRYKTSEFGYNLVHFWDAVRNQQDYLNKISILESRTSSLDEIKKENARLKRLLSFTETLSDESIGVRIIGEDLTPWRKRVVIDKGKSQKIDETGILVVPEGVVGRIIEVGPLTSTAILLSDPDSRVSVLSADSRSQGIIAGEGTGKLKMKYLALDAQVNVGEEIITSGVGGIFPKGLIVGTIESVSRDSDGLHLEASVKPSVIFSKLEEILCLVSSRGK